MTGRNDKSIFPKCQFRLFKPPGRSGSFRAAITQSIARTKRIMRCRIVGAPVQDGAGRMGCEMGPSALRTAGLVSVLSELGHEVEDWGAVQPAATRAVV